MNNEAKVSEPVTCAREGLAGKWTRWAVFIHPSLPAHPVRLQSNDGPDGHRDELGYRPMGKYRSSLFIYPEYRLGIRPYCITILFDIHRPVLHACLRSGRISTGPNNTGRLIIFSLK